MTRFSADALAGAGVLVEGANSDSDTLAAFLERLGARVSRVERLAGARLTLDGLAFLFVDSRGFPAPSTPLIAEARARGLVVSILADLILELSPVPTVCVTGSAGKSTTTNLIARILEAAGERVHIARDNHRDNPWPNWELLEQVAAMRAPAWLVGELTNTHLEYMRSSPDVAVITNLWPDHVEWHGSFDAYVDAKATILEHQSPAGWAVLNADDQSRERFEPRCRGRVVHFSRERAVERGVFVDGGEILARWDGKTEAIAPVADVRLGLPYVADVLAASAAAIAAGAPPRSLGAPIRDFGGLAQRLEAVGQAGGVRIVNDGMAITPGKAGAALESLAGRPLVLVSGGETQTFWSSAIVSSDEEKRQLESVCRLAAARAKGIVVFGPAAPILEQGLAGAGFTAARLRRATTLEAAAVEAAALAERGDTILLAPIFYIAPEDASRFTRAVRSDLVALERRR